jgi:hypothetical protein
MRIPSSGALLMLCAIAGSCAPEDKCSGELYFEEATGLCRTCPMDSTFRNGTCKCKAQYAFVKNRCVLKDGEVIEPPDAGMLQQDTGMPSGVGCTDYCGFAKSCIGGNSLAQAALPTIITGLHADDEQACAESCQTDLGSSGAGDPVVACIEAGREAAACAGQSSQQALAAALMLVADCCGPRKDNALCRSICVPLKANPLTAGMVTFCD